MSTFPDEPGFLAAITAAPDDDTPRLVYADWLQEHGREDRAEFIRVQVALARTPVYLDAEGASVRNPAREGLRRREYELLERSARWRGPAWDALAAAWHERAAAAGLGLAQRRPRATFRRGFVDEVRVEAPDWVRYGGPVAAEQPVRVVQIVGVEPDGPDAAGEFVWEREDGPTWFGIRPSVLPAPLFDLLDGVRRPSTPAVWFGSADAARDALGRACLRYARREADRLSGRS